MEHSHSSVSRRQNTVSFDRVTETVLRGIFFYGCNFKMHVTGQNTHMILYIHIYIYSSFQGFIAYKL